MTIHTLDYSLDSKGIKIVGGCAMNCIIEEQEEAVKVAFRNIKLTVDIDEDYGFCRILAVDGLAVEQT